MKEDYPVLGNWERLIFHLPYAAHGRRIASELFMIELKAIGKWGTFAKENELIEPQKVDFEDDATFNKAYGKFLRAITKTKGYKEFTINKLAKAEVASGLVGNMYACSIFLALMSTFEEDLLEGENLAGKDFGFVGYGSGSKSKVFEARIQPQWKAVVQTFETKRRLKERTEIDYPTYEALHRMQLTKSVIEPKGEFRLSKISTEPMKEGARYYEWVAAASSRKSGAKVLRGKVV